LAAAGTFQGFWKGAKAEVILNKKAPPTRIVVAVINFVFIFRSIFLSINVNFVFFTGTKVVAACSKMTDKTTKNV
jgi:hypothetical protein